MSDTPRTNSILERATIDIDGLPQSGPITLRHWMVISTIITSLGTESKQLERELAAVTAERDDLKAELQKYHLGTVEAHNIIYDLRKERDEANAESEKYRIGWGKCDDQLNEARAALREAIQFRDCSLSGYDLEFWIKAAGLDA